RARRAADRLRARARRISASRARRQAQPLCAPGRAAAPRAGRGLADARAARDCPFAGNPLELGIHLVCACAPPGSECGIDAAQAASAALRCPISVTMRAGSTETTTRFAADRTPGGTGMSLRRG